MLDILTYFESLYVPMLLEMNHIFQSQYKMGNIVDMTITPCDGVQGTIILTKWAILLCHGSVSFSMALETSVRFLMACCPCFLTDGRDQSHRSSDRVLQARELWPVHTLQRR